MLRLVSGAALLTECLLNSYGCRSREPKSPRHGTIGRNSLMGTFTNHGWSTSSDEIPQPTSILLGRKLRANSEQPSKQQKPVPVKQPAAPEKA